MQESPRQPAIKQNLCHSKVQLCHSGLQQKDTCRLQRRGSPGSGPGPPRPCGWSGAEGGIRERSGRLYECDSRQLTLSPEGWPWSTPAWRMRRTGGAGRRGPSPRFLCPHRHLVTPGTVRTSPCPPAWLAGLSILHRLGTSVRIPREWFPQQQPPHGRFQNFRLLLAAPQRAWAGGRALVTDPNLLWWAEDRQARRGLADAPRWRAAKLLSGSESLSYYYNFLLEVAPSIAQRRVCLALGKTRPRAFGGVELFSGTAFGSAWQRRRPRGS